MADKLGDFDYICINYNVPAKPGGRVTYTGDGDTKKGTIKGAKNGRLQILLDGDKKPGHYHPTWCLEYEKD